MSVFKGICTFYCTEKCYEKRYFTVNKMQKKPFCSISLYKAVPEDSFLISF
uniref:Uncharacterized protein n=1 Tax=Anguilla anguilla TaxID=7936 RepID=A0A0E9XD26_ANGAN